MSQSKEIENWIKQTHGWFSYYQMDVALHLITPQQKTLRRVVINRMRRKGLLKAAPDRPAIYKYSRPLKEINWQAHQ